MTRLKPRLKLRDFITAKKVLALLALMLLIGWNVGVIGAEGDGQKREVSITTGYKSSSDLQRGMIVGFNKENTDVAEAIDLSRIDDAEGVVTHANESPVTLSDEDSQIFIAFSGEQSMFVSSESGEISKGDYVSVSSLAGIGKLATHKESSVFGVAQEDFKAEGNKTKECINDSEGNCNQVYIGRIKVRIQKEKNPLAKPESSVTPEWLGKISTAIAGKTLSPAKIYLSAGLMLAGIIITLAILYSGIRSSIISIGRNPLSKGSILVGLVQVIATSLIVFIISVFGVYLLLKI